VRKTTAIAASVRPFSIPREQKLELKQRVSRHNGVARVDRQADLTQVLTVYRRGAREQLSLGLTASCSTHDWALARVDAFLSTLKNGRPINPMYVGDRDLLPACHPCAGATAAVAASAATSDDLLITLSSEDDYESSEDAIISMAEFTGLGYDAVPAFRAAWRRAVAENDDPFSRVKTLATQLYASKDADLLPFKNKKMGIS
jgi:hypothetical protein